MSNNPVLWRGIYLRGHEACRLIAQDKNWHLEGTAVFSHNHEPCRLTYLVVCDQRWYTLRGSVAGWVGNQSVDLEITVHSDRSWQLNGTHQPAVAGCIDLDLNFSPSTNLLPIRRLSLSVGHEAEVNAAWLRFPSFQLERLSQRYRRTGELTYHYESSNDFEADLEVNSDGFVINYPDLWEAER